MSRTVELGAHTDGVFSELHQFSPEIIILPTPHDVDRFAADVFAGQIRKNPETIATLPTGSTPEGLYERTVASHRAGQLDMSGVLIRNLDKYVGLSPFHPQSYRYFMVWHLLRHVNVPPGHFHIPRGDTPDPHAEAARYERLLTMQGPSDLTILGIGRGGHIAFNMPGTSPYSRVRVVHLDEQTIRANSRFFEGSTESVPKMALTQGIGNILETRGEIMVLAKGESKAFDIRAALKGPVGMDVPASFLRWHPRVRYVLDSAAASLLDC